MNRAIRLIPLIFSAILALHSAHAATPTLKVHFKCDETTGTVATDSSGSGNNGTYANGPFFVPFGRVDGAVRLGGNAEAITMAANNTILDGAPSVTFAGWFKPTVLPNSNTRLISFSLPGAAGSARFIVRALASPNGRTARVDAGGRVTDNTGEALQLGTTTADVLQLEEYTHVAAVLDIANDAVRIYINGALAATTGTIAFTPTALPATGSAAGAFGAASDNSGEQFRGEMDDVRLYTGAYDNTAAEAAFIAALAVPAISAGPDRLVPPGTPVTLNATFNPAPASVTWALVSGPGTVTFGSPNAASTSFTHTVPGAYLVRLTANFGTYVSHDEVYIGESPAAHFKLDENTGTTTVDTVGNLAPGTLLPAGNPPAWVGTAKIDSGLNFDGTNDTVRLPANNNLIRNASAISFSAWVKIPTATSTVNRVIASFSTNAAGTTRASFRVTTTGTLQLGVRGTDADGGYALGSAAVLAVGTYQHVAAVCNYRTNRLELFINGVSAAVGTPTTTGEFRDLKISDTASVASAIGSLYTEAAEFFGGEVDDLRIYTRPLSPAEIAGLAAINVKNDSYSTGEDVALTRTSANGVLANDASLLTTPLPLNASVVTGPSNGSLLLNADGSFTYTPSLNFIGNDSFTYRAGDGTNTSVLGVVSLQVTEVNDPPVATADSGAGLSTPEDTALVITPSRLLTNDTPGPAHEAAQSLSVTAVSAASTQGGTVVILGGGNIQYTPPLNFNGTDTFTYTITDNGTTNGANDFRTASTTVQIVVTTVNDAPVAAADSGAGLSVSEDNALVILPSLLLTNDSPGPANEAAQTISITAVSAASTQGGTVVILGGGNIQYTPPLNFNGTDTFTYTITDNGTTNSVNDFRTATAAVQIVVTPVNDVPTANADTYPLHSGQTLVVPASGVLANDLDVDAGETATLQAVLTTGPATGTLTLQANGGFTYVPTGSFVGIVTFTYQARDTASTLSTPVTVTIDYQLNQAPVAGTATITVVEDTPQSFNFPVTDSTNDPLTVTLQTPPTKGTVTIVDGIPAPTYTFTPALNANGADSFVYVVSDGVLTASATITVNITPVNDAPVAVDIALEAGTDLTRVGTLTGSDPVENDPVLFSLVSLPTNGVLVLNNAQTGAFSYTPAPGFAGSDSFTFVVNDGALNSNIATVFLTVLPPPGFASLPSVVPNPVTVNQPVSGTAVATNGVMSWNWGDGSQSSGNSVSHIYAATGVYTVTTTITAGSGLTTVFTQDVFVAATLTNGNGNNGGGAAAPGIVIGEGGLGPKDGGQGKIVCNYVKRDKSMYSGSLKGLALPASVTQALLENKEGTLTIGSTQAGGTPAQFRFFLNKRGTGKATGLPQIKFDIKKNLFSFKAQRADLTELTEKLGGTRRFDNVREVKILTVPVTLQIGREVFVLMTFQLKFQQIGNNGKAGI